MYTKHYPVPMRNNCRPTFSEFDHLIICILKWGAWKTRNYIKYNKRIYREKLVSVTHVCTYIHHWI